MADGRRITMKDLSGTIIDKIKQENIRPYPKWRFTVSRGCIVVLFLTSILLGFLGTAIALFQIRNSEWELYHHAGHSFAEFILLSLPWFWLLVLCGLTTVSFYYFRKMGRGYKYNTLLVVGVSLVMQAWPLRRS